MKLKMKRPGTHKDIYVVNNNDVNKRQIAHQLL